MSKLAIFLCAALIASAVNASYVSDALVAADAKFEGLIEATVNATKVKFDNIKTTAADRIVQLEVDAKAASEKVSQQIRSSLEKAQAELGELTTHEKSVDCTECNKFSSELETIGNAIIANMSACVEDKLTTGNGYVQNIDKLAETVLANLTTIRNEARHCSDNVDGVKDAAAAIACTNLAALKTAWVETKAVPSLLIEMTKIRYLIVTLQPSLIYCRVSHGVIAFYYESTIMAEKTKQCIEQKKQEVRPSTEEVPTEKPKDAST